MLDKRSKNARDALNVFLTENWDDDEADALIDQLRKFERQVSVKGMAPLLALFQALDEWCEAHPPLRPSSKGKANHDIRLVWDRKQPRD